MSRWTIHALDGTHTGYITIVHFEDRTVWTLTDVNDKVIRYGSRAR